MREECLFFGSRGERWRLSVLGAISIAFLATPSAFAQTGRPTDIKAHDAKTVLAAANSLSLDEEGQLACELEWGSTYKVSSGVLLHGSRAPVGMSVNVEGVSKEETGRASLMVYRGHWNCYSKPDAHELVYSLLVDVPSLRDTVRLLKQQFHFLGECLKQLHTGLEKLRRRYEGLPQDNLKPIEEDIRMLSRKGMILAEATKNLFTKAAPRLIDYDQKKQVLTVRKEALAGLQDFSEDIQRVARLVESAGSDQSFSEIVAEIDKAVAELEKAISQVRDIP